MDEFMLQKGMEVNGVPPTNGGNDKVPPSAGCLFHAILKHSSKLCRQVPVTLLTGFLGAGKTVGARNCSKEKSWNQFLYWSQWTDPKAFSKFIYKLSVLGTLNSNCCLFSSWQFFTCPRHDSTLHWKKARVGSGCPSTVEIVVHLSSGQGASHPTYFGIEPGWTWRKIDKTWYQSVAFSDLKEFWRRGIIGTTCDTRTLQIAVIENEIGALGVDGALVANAHSEAGCPKKHLGLDSLSFFENARLMMVS